VVFCAIAGYLSIYPGMLIVAVPLIVHRIQEKKVDLFVLYISCFILFFGFLISLFLLSFYWVGSLQFLRKCYGFVLLVDNLQPNIGIFWYFLTEMFQSFRVFFLCLYFSFMSLCIVYQYFTVRETIQYLARGCYCV